ncbi:hypothetical protein GCM10008927_11870 [Amylibacter ulvae]|uniref:Glycosyl transferase family 8 n=1 Tax=Paramylibacter ulvae TaxID=1651968 RepID=A0ABQ3CXC9_9RHOB|nr:glycosyltransferase family 8 protein [Amylibacter ulvae]GHA48420.1 hypothetical protein GCM10008927_11870 [Amylibacter ulvae]
MTNRPLSGIAITLTHAGVMDQLVNVVNWHLNQGVIHVFIYLDRPLNDYSELFSSDPRVSITHCTMDYWKTRIKGRVISVEAKQMFALKTSLDLAKEMGVRYLASIDSDELVYAPQPLADLLDKQPENFGSFMLSVVEARHSPTSDVTNPFGADIFLKRNVANTWFGVRKGKHTSLQRKGFFGYTTGKTIYKIPANYASIGVHRPNPKNDELKVSKLESSFGHILHFDCGNIETWRAKWTQRLIGTTLARGMREKRRQQLTLFANAYTNGLVELERLYRSLFVLPQNQIDRLESKGNLFSPNLADTDFDQPYSAKNVKGFSSFDICPEYPVLPRNPVKYQFAMACDRNFVKPAYACILSVMDKMDPNQPVRIFLLVDSLLPEDFAHLNSLSDVFKNLQLHICDETLKLDRDVGIKDKKRATFSRLYLPEHIQSGRVIYIDSDMLVMKDISYLFDMDMGDNIIAGASDSAAIRIKYNPKSISADKMNRLVNIAGGEENILDYLNAGLLVLNMNHPEYKNRALRSLEMLKTDATALVQRDQDAVNIVFSGKKMLLTSRVNYMIQFFYSSYAETSEIQKIKDEHKDAEIFHFSGKKKPWHSGGIAPKEYSLLYRETVKLLEEKWNANCGFTYLEKPKTSVPNIGQRVINKIARSLR